MNLSQHIAPAKNRRTSRWVRSVRPRIQRVFLNWFADNRHRFMIPVTIARRNDREIEFHLAGITSKISVVLDRWCLRIIVTHKGEWFDDLANFDVCIVKDGESYFCSLEIEEERTAYTSREALWRDLVCEAFLAWVNDRLAPARWLRLAKSAGIREAKLLKKMEHGKRADSLTLLAQLVSLDGNPLIGADQEFNIWIYPIDSDQALEHFSATLPGQ